MANSVNPGQTAAFGACSSGFALFDNTYVFEFEGLIQYAPNHKQKCKIIINV